MVFCVYVCLFVLVLLVRVDLCFCCVHCLVLCVFVSLRDHLLVVVGCGVCLGAGCLFVSVVVSLFVDGLFV